MTESTPNTLMGGNDSFKSFDSARREAHFDARLSILQVEEKQVTNTQLQIEARHKNFKLNVNEGLQQGEGGGIRPDWGYFRLVFLSPIHNYVPQHGRYSCIMM